MNRAVVEVEQRRRQSPRRDRRRPGLKLPPDLEQYRGYLRRLAELYLAAKLRPRLDAPDIVQQVLMKANVAVSGLQHSDSTSLKAWLKTIPANELIDAFRFRHRNRRDIDR